MGMGGRGTGVCSGLGTGGWLLSDGCSGLGTGCFGLGIRQCFGRSLFSSLGGSILGVS